MVKIRFFINGQMVPYEETMAELLLKHRTVSKTDAASEDFKRFLFLVVYDCEQFKCRSGISFFI